MRDRDRLEEGVGGRKEEDALDDDGGLTEVPLLQKTAFVNFTFQQPTACIRGARFQRQTPRHSKVTTKTDLLLVPML